MSIIIGVIEEGLIYAIMALGLYITYKILDFPDLSVDGTFPMGAAVTAMLILKGVHPALTLVLSFAAGLLAGCITGLIHVKLKVRDLLSEGQQRALAPLLPQLEPPAFPAPQAPARVLRQPPAPRRDYPDWLCLRFLRKSR